MTETIPQLPSMEEEPPIMREEVARDIKVMAEGKATGFDCVTGEELNASGETGIDILHKLCHKILEKETFPDDWGTAIIFILQMRMQQKTEEILSEVQPGFRPGRSTVDRLFSLRQIGEKYLEKKRMFIVAM